MKKANCAGRETLSESFSELPAHVRSVIDTKRTLFNKVDVYSKDQLAQQAQTLQVAQKALDVTQQEPNFVDKGRVLVVDAATSRALRDYLEGQQSYLKTKGSTKEFEPRAYEKDRKALDALDELVRLRRIDAGVHPGDVNDLMVHLMAMEQGDGLISNISGEDAEKIEALGKAVAARNLLEIIITGKAPSGVTGMKAAPEIEWEPPWTLKNAGDMFFSEKVYKTLWNEKWGTGSDTPHVDMDLLFNKNDYSERNYEILIEAAENAGINPDGPNRVLSEMAVGKIAIEIMKIKAEQVWCDKHAGETFDPTKIHAMIHNKEFMPDRSDLRLVDVGFGVPDEPVQLDNNEFANLQEMADKMGPESWNLEYSGGFGHIIQQHRIDAFCETFGEMPQDALERAAAIYLGVNSDHHIPGVVDHMGQIDNSALYARAREIAGTPAMYFKSPPTILGYTKPSQYDLDRAEYLKHIQPVVEDGCASAKAGGKMSEAFQDAARTGDIIKENLSDACVVEDQLYQYGPERFLPENDPSKATLPADLSTPEPANVGAP